MSDEAGRAKNVFNIPAGVPFVTSLARAILNGDLPHPGGKKPGIADLPGWTVLLPTRRAARALAIAFYEVSGNRALLLPRIQPLGDIDDDELALSHFTGPAGAGDLPPAISAMERRFILYHEIVKWQQTHAETPLARLLASNRQHGLDLARTLSRLVDEFEISGVDISIIPDLFEGEFAGHREQILQFLSIVQIALPQKLAQLQRLNPPERRNRLIEAYQNHLHNGDQSRPIIAAGSTGSIPATARLLSTIADLENGAVVLPGLDTAMDDESWRQLPEHHPQFALRELLGKMELPREAVRKFPSVSLSPVGKARNWLASEIMRPAETTDQWRAALTGNSQTITQATTNLTVLAADEPTHEARIIALIMRWALDEQKTAALITPDRALARSVKGELRRWIIDVDDSAGLPLRQTSQAIFLRLMLDAAAANFSPLKLKALLAHPMAIFAQPWPQLQRANWLLEMCVLRTRKPYHSLDELLHLATNFADTIAHDKYLLKPLQKLSKEDLSLLSSFAALLVQALKPLQEAFASLAPVPLAKLVETHLTVAEEISADADGTSMLWLGDEGAALGDFFASVLAAQHLAPDMSAAAYRAFLDDHLSDSTVRTTAPSSDQLSILGLLEARLVSADVTILGGLNETVWPAITETDPWLNRTQLKNAGLSVPEQRTGLSAHDFVQAFCNDTVFLTYSQKRSNSPVVPSRWLLRFQAMLSSADMVLEEPQNWLSWARRLDAPERFAPVSRPAPKPETSLRPRRYSVTGIDTLRANPYRFFADKILGLKQLDELDEQAGPIERGQIVHLGLHHFVRDFPASLPENPAVKLMEYFETAMDEFISDPARKVFWRPQLQRMAEWFCQNEQTLRQNQIGTKLEVDGTVTFTINNDKYVLTARADRVDILDDDTLRIIDYKTGEAPSFKATAEKYKSQLLLEAEIARQGGFENLAARQISNLVYIKLSGGVPAGEITSLVKGLSGAVKEAWQGTRDLLAAYADPAQAYLAADDAKSADWDAQYQHLSRWREWSHLATRGDGDG